MNEPVAYAVSLLAVGVALYALWHLVADRPLGNPLFYAVAGVELVLLALLVGGSVALARTDRDVDGVLFVSYLATVVVLPPGAVFWAIAEKSRWGTGVVLVAMAAVAVLVWRLLGIWDGSYA